MVTEKKTELFKACYKETERDQFMKLIEFFFSLKYNLSNIYVLQ